MNTRSILLAAALTVSAGAAALADPVTSGAAGKFLYDQQGEQVGSFDGLTDGGRSAVIRIGFIGQPGSHQATVPAGALNVANGRVTLEPQTLQALNSVR